ncbi:MAG: Tm-1-like ATP-binding domain-containing protein, partial [Spirochaetes bacterium]|nr:Tm-1-like ATP-binding domain-containing protein [Spirochaetota bacterium]
VKIESRTGDKPLIGMSNIGLATRGTIKALELFKEKGYDVIVFHAVGSGGRAMEQMMKDGIIGAVLDYALVEIPNEIYHGLNAGGPDRLKTAGQLGLPQVICPAGVEHIGLILSEPNKGPEEHMHRKYYFHSPIIFVYRLEKDEMLVTAREVADRLQYTKDEAIFMIPKKGFDRSCYEGSPLYDPEGDAAFIAELKSLLPKNIRVIERDYKVEDPEFVEEAVNNLISLIEKRK